jgi:DNA polymerase elongation subunit (family B)
MNETPNYIAAVEDWLSEEVIVWERTADGRKAIRYKSPYYFFIPSDKGEFTSMFGDSLIKLEFDTREEFKMNKALYPIKFESDFSVTERVLMDNYYGRPTPTIHYSFFDIEVDIDDTGFPDPEKALQPINAITLYNQWEDTYYCLAVPPKGFVGTFIPDLSLFGYEKLKNLVFEMVESEAMLLSMFIDLLEDCDFLSGWNSEFFDLPYIYNRSMKVLGVKNTQELCFPGTKPPSVKTKKQFGKEQQVIELHGRSHLDYLAMFKKFTFEGRTSYAIGNICEEELEITKLEYDGTLIDLYNKEFEKFCCYNIIDVVLLTKLDLKFNFVALVNQMAHENTTPFQAILGTTKYVDTGFTNYAHNVLDVKVKDKDVVANHGKVEGAIVLTPFKGLHEWVGSVDINSLYPSVLRSLNMSPETYLGQFDTLETFERVQTLPEVQQVTKDAKKKNVDLSNFFIAMAKEYDWRGIYAEDNFIHTAKMKSGEFISKTGKDWKVFLKEQKWALSAYGTIFDQSGKQGIVPALLEFWYSERKVLQKELKAMKKKEKELLALGVDKP